MIDLQEESACFLVLAVLALFESVRQGRLGALLANLAQAGRVVRGTTFNGYAMLFLWLVMAQAVGWAGALATYGWSGIVKIQTGQ